MSHETSARPGSPSSWPSYLLSGKSPKAKCAYIGPAEGQASVWCSDSQLREKLSCEEGVTPRATSDILNAPKFCRDPSVLGTNFPCPPLPPPTCLWAVRGAVFPLPRAMAAGMGKSPYFSWPAPVHPAGTGPSLHISTLSCCWEGQKNGAGEEKPSKVALPTRVICCPGCSGA